MERKASLLTAETVKSGAALSEKAQKEALERSKKAQKTYQDNIDKQKAELEKLQGKFDEKSLHEKAVINVKINKEQKSLEREVSSAKKIAANNTNMLKAGLSAVTNFTKTGNMTGGKSYGE